MRKGDKGQSKVVWRGPIEDTYNAKLTFLREKNQPIRSILLFERQFGAAFAEVDVFLQSQSEITRTNQIDGTYLTLENLDSGSVSFVVAHDHAYLVDVPDLFRWNGKAFVDVSKGHPEYYRPLLDSLRNEDPLLLSSWAMFGYSQIAELARDRTTAIRLLNSALVQERSKRQGSDLDFIQRIEKELERANRSR